MDWLMKRLKIDPRLSDDGRAEILYQYGVHHQLCNLTMSAKSWLSLEPLSRASIIRAALDLKGAPSPGKTPSSPSPDLAVMDSEEQEAAMVREMADRASKELK